MCLNIDGKRLWQWLSSIIYSVMAVMKQKNIRQAEKSLKDLLDKADNNANGKVELTDFLKILEANGVEVSVTVTDFSKIYSIRCTECFSRKETSATQFKV